MLSSIKPIIKRRVAWAVAIATVLIVIVVGTLSFAYSYSIIDFEKRCALNFGKSKWPMWIGCVMAAKQDLAAGLIGGAGALFAAWLAFDAVQEQISEERERRRRQQAEAKEVAAVCIAPPIHAAAAALAEIDRARKARGQAEAEADQRVDVATKYVQSALESFTVREIGRDLGLDDRLIYLAIIGTLTTFVNIRTQPSPALNRIQSLQNQRNALMNIHTYLRGFDTELAKVYARDSKTKPE